MNEVLLAFVHRQFSFDLPLKFCPVAIRASGLSEADLWDHRRLEFSGGPFTYELRRQALTKCSRTRPAETKADRQFRIKVMLRGGRPVLP